MIILYIVLTVILLAIAGIMLFMRSASFGRLPSGQRLERIKRSPNYRDGEFHNLSNTPALKEGTSMLRVFFEFFFRKSKNSRPKNVLPSQKTDLKSLRPDENVLVWFGHSSYFIQADGKKILVDPVFSGNASPVTFTTKAFKGADVYDVDDLPEIDLLILTHDHWDHLDYPTIIKLKPKVKQIVTGLGTGEHLEAWGYSPAIIEEKDWNETTNLGSGFTIHTTPARHFSGRTFVRNRSLWMSFVLQTPSFRIFLGGDSGYDTFFKEIGEAFGPFDLAILECGQYNEYWKYIHMMPEETVQAALELGAKKLLPVHWGKFSLSLHAWDEPINRVTAASEREGMPLLMPMIGQKVLLDAEQIFERWWETVD